MSGLASGLKRGLLRLAAVNELGWTEAMIVIRFPDTEVKRAALARLAGRFSFKSWASGEMLVPEDALPFLAVEGIVFTVEGPATYEQNGAAFRGPAAAAV